MDFLLPFLARWIHIASAITLLGGVIFAIVAWLPGLRTLPDAERQTVSDAIAAKFRPWLLLAMLGLLASGFYNYYRATLDKVPSFYHMAFGMKFLLALHVFAVGYLSLNRANAKRQRQLVGVLLSGLVIIALSGWMRVLHIQTLAHYVGFTQTAPVLPAK